MGAAEVSLSLPGPLVSVAWLADAIADPSLRVVDCRWYLGRPGEGRAAYDAGHLPGALHLDVDFDLTASQGPGRHPLPDPAVFRARMERVGIGDGHTVVAYDDAGGWVASRLWWMLDDLGHRDVAVLDGGIGAWTAAGHTLTTEVPSFPAAHLTLRDHWDGVIERDALRTSLGSVRLLDARAEARYRGETEPIDAYPGHIPTAVSAPTDGNLASDGRFLPAEALAERYRTLGADGSNGGVVVSCGSGVSATHDALALRIAGLPDAVLYPGSYSDWTQQGWPVATGPEPGDPPESTDS
ncbi:MAG TPA: sulfurtransferase [Marmoricola sp.]|nr:sulfurtransferase [Marmoricola sp.]